MSTQAQRKVKMPPNTEIQIDPDVKIVLEFMQANVPIRKCVEVASAVNALALILWGRYVKPTDRYDQDYFVPIRLQRKPLSPDDMSIQSTTKE
jgi:hypothetical protein